MRNTILSRAWLAAGIALACLEFAAAPSQVQTTVCLAATSAEIRDGATLRLRGRVEGGEFLSIADDSCKFQRLLWIEDGPSANEASLRRLKEAVLKAYLHNTSIRQKHSSDGYWAVTASVVGALVAKPLYGPRQIRLTDAWNISIGFEKPLNPPPPIVNKP
jgi:hypothetical protein